jgi:hypothetical protein
MAMPAIRREEAVGPAVAPVTAVWPVSWSGVWVGALAAIAMALLIGLVGLAVGAHQVTQGQLPAGRPGFWGLVLTVAGAFFSFVVGGWAAGKITGDARSEVTSLHGAIAWVLAVPLFVVLFALGAGNYLGGWFSGLAWLADPSASGTASPALARAVRNAALGGLTSMVIGLAGAVLGGWMASGEPMSVRYRREEPRRQTGRA